jgi:hypothetical protein
MQTANGRVIVGYKDSDVMVSGVTPAEAAFLWDQFHANAGKCPLISMKLGPEVKRTDREEFARLRSKYIVDKLNKFYPGENPRLAQRFDDVFSQEQLIEMGLVQVKEVVVEPPKVPVVAKPVVAPPTAAAGKV